MPLTGSKSRVEFKLDFIEKFRGDQHLTLLIAPDRSLCLSTKLLTTRQCRLSEKTTIWGR